MTPAHDVQEGACVSLDRGAHRKHHQTKISLRANAEPKNGVGREPDGRVEAIGSRKSCISAVQQGGAHVNSRKTGRILADPGISLTMLGHSSFAVAPASPRRPPTTAPRRP